MHANEYRRDYAFRNTVLKSKSSQSHSHNDYRTLNSVRFEQRKFVSIVITATETADDDNENNNNNSKSKSKHKQNEKRNA